MSSTARGAAPSLPFDRGAAGGSALTSTAAPPRPAPDRRAVPPSPRWPAPAARSARACAPAPSAPAPGTPRRRRVGAGEVGDRAQHALAPQEFVRKGRDLAHVDAAADHRAALAHRAQRHRHQAADRREQHGGVERLGRRLGGGSGPGAAEAEREGAARGVVGPGEGEDAPSLPDCQLRDQVCGGAETVDAEGARFAGEAQRAVADQPGAQQRRGVRVVEADGQGEGVRGVGEHQPGVAAVARVAVELRRVAQVLAPGGAMKAVAAGGAEPGHADAVAGAEALDAGADRGDAADHLVAEDQRQLRLGQVAVGHVQVGAANAAGGDLDQHLAGGGIAEVEAAREQRPARSVEHHRRGGAHRRLSRAARAPATAPASPRRGPSRALRRAAPAARPRRRVPPSSATRTGTSGRRPSGPGSRIPAAA